MQPTDLSVTEVVKRVLVRMCKVVRFRCQSLCIIKRSIIFALNPESEEVADDEEMLKRVLCVYKLYSI